MGTEEKKEQVKEDDLKEVALGICFGSGIGIVIGAIINMPSFGLSLGGVLGILAALTYKAIKKKVS